MKVLEVVLAGAGNDDLTTRGHACSSLEPRAARPAGPERPKSALWALEFGP
jgi:hypothetical protein